MDLSYPDLLDKPEVLFHTIKSHLHKRSALKKGKKPVFEQGMISTKGWKSDSLQDEVSCMDKISTAISVTDKGH